MNLIKTPMSTLLKSMDTICWPKGPGASPEAGGGDCCAKLQAGAMQQAPMMKKQHAIKNERGVVVISTHLGWLKSFSFRKRVVYFNPIYITGCCS
jgi:hypothetical protein